MLENSQNKKLGLVPVPLTSRLLWANKTVHRVIVTLFVFVAVLFLDTLRSVTAHSEKIDGAAAVSPLERQTLFRHQRNLYLTGITLFLLLVLHRFQATLNDLFAAEQKAAAVSASGLGAIVDERDALATKCAALEKRVAELVASEKATEKAVAALKKQAENNQAEYARQLDEKTKKTPQAKKSD